MISLVCTEPGTLKYTETHVPTPAPDEILVRIRAAGVCGTDLHAFAGRQPYFSYPRIFGHELAGIIANANGHTMYNEGDMVTVIPYFHCGKCIACRVGKTNCCSSLKVAGVHTDGGFREYFAVPAYAVRKVNGLHFEQLAVVEPLCIGEHALERAAPSPDDEILILGAGPIGIGLAMLAALRNLRVTIADHDPFRMDFCDNIPGVETIRLYKDDKSLIRNRFPEGAGKVFDATGNLEAIHSCLEHTASGGSIILVGLQKEAFTFSHPEFHRKEITLMSSRNATLKEFDQVIRYMTEGKLNTASYVTHSFSFMEAADKFSSLTDKNNHVIKAVIHF